MKPNHVIKCYRCRKRCRNTQGWNVEVRAGLTIGALCPGCQTVEEDLEAQVNEAMGSSNLQAQRLDSGSVESYIHMLLDRYPTPQAMRSTANKISNARQDTQASEVTRLMRQLADAMESGELYTD